MSGSNHDPASSGILHSLRGLGDNLVGTVRERIELFSIELQEEKFSMIQIFIWISAAVFSGVMAITFASITVVYLFWETARLPVLIGLTALYTISLGAILWSFKRYLARQPRPFAATLSELDEDRACFRDPN